MAPKDHVLESAEMAPKGSRVGVCGDGTERITCWSLWRWHRKNHVLESSEMALGLSLFKIFTRRSQHQISDEAVCCQRAFQWLFVW